METRFTKGPWYVGETGVFAPEGWQVAATPDQQAGLFTPQGTANAHLIAASPDLYEALAEAVDETYLWGADHPLRLKWKAALARARGEQP